MRSAAARPEGFGKAEIRALDRTTDGTGHFAFSND
jgi:hypothetical protein